MVTIAPVTGLLYDRDLAGPESETSAPAWSEVDRFDRAARRTSNPYTVLELHAIDPSATPRGRFATARGALERWRRTGVLTPLPAPAMGLYRMTDTLTGSVHEGLICTLDLDDEVLLHEHVDHERARSRALRLQQVPVDTTPVVALHFGTDDVAQHLLDAVPERTGPLRSLTDEDGVRHEIWTITAPVEQQLLARTLADVDVVLADGHHRVAAAHRHARHAGSPPQTLALLMDAHHRGPDLHAVHRLVQLAHADPVQRLDAMDGVTCASFDGDLGALRDATCGDPTTRCYGLASRHGRWRVEVRRDVGRELLDAADVSPVLADLDVVILHEVLFGVLGVTVDTALPDALVTGAADVRQMLGAADAVLLLQPPRADQVMAVASAGQRMPPKTTWFRPKPRAGLLMRALEPDDPR